METPFEHSISSELPTLRTNSNAEITAVSDAWQEAFVSVSQLPMPLWGFLEVHDPGVAFVYEEQAAKGKPFHLAFQIQKDDQSVWVRVMFHPIKGLEKQFDSVWMIMEQNEVQGRKTNDVLESIGQNLEEGFFRTSPSGNIDFANAALARMFGYSSAEDLYTISASRFYADPVQREQLMFELSVTGRVSNKQMLMRRKNGEIFWGLINVTQQQDEEGSVRIDGSLRDITSIKEIEKELKIQMQNARAASLAKQQFLSTISHELRTPLNAVVGLSHILNESEPREDQKEHLSTLKYSAENLLSLINDVLDFSKIEAKKVELSIDWFELRPYLQKTIESFRNDAEKKSISFELNVNENVPSHIYSDPFRLGQIINNLISNALKFTFHGTIKLGVDLKEKRGDIVTLEFKVSDTGIGIPNSKLTKVFDLFTQASSNTTRKFGGTGLGLAIVKGLVELFDGDIKVESEPGEGTEFTFTILTSDHSPAQEHAIPEVQAAEESKFPGIRILAVEDNEVNQLLLIRYLQDFGVDVTLASDGVEALILAEEQHYDLILMDIQMPEMDGYATTRQLRKLEHPNAQIPVIAVTASMLSEIEDQCREAGMDDVLLKPYVPADLSAIIGKNLLV